MILQSHSAQIAHLLRRTGFTATKQQVDAWQSKPLTEVVEQLLQSPDTHPQPPQNLSKTDHSELQLWWLDSMVHSTNPLQEKMTLFWHGHFTSALSKVNSPPLMAQQNVLLRKHALGNFRQLTVDISIDPAMLIWLDNTTNVRRAPNENYARELMELFTLGLGHYTETDIKQVARALTGWRVDRATGLATFHPNQHDSGLKTIFGQTAPFDLKSTVDLILQQPACPAFIAGELWSFFGYPNPEPQVIQPLADAFVKNDYDIKALLRAILTSDAFYSDRAYRSVVKNPAEYVVGMLALFPKLQLKNKELVLGAMSMMGQTLFNPPNVAGWPGGAAWLSASLLFARLHFADWVTESLSPSDFPLDPHLSNSELLQTCLERTGLTDVSDQTLAQLQSYLQKEKGPFATRLQGLLHLLFLTPEAQMK